MTEDRVFAWMMAAMVFVMFTLGVLILALSALIFSSL